MKVMPKKIQKSPKKKAYSSYIPSLPESWKKLIVLALPWLCLLDSANIGALFGVSYLNVSALSFLSQIPIVSLVIYFAFIPLIIGVWLIYAVYFITFHTISMRMIAVSMHKPPEWITIFPFLFLLIIVYLLFQRSKIVWYLFVIASFFQFLAGIGDVVAWIVFAISLYILFQIKEYYSIR